MPNPESSSTATPVETAGFLLATRPLALAHGLAWPSVDEIFAATGANRAAAHELEAAIVAALPTLEQTLRELRAAAEAARWQRIEALAREALRFALRYPGSAQHGAEGRYSARFRRFARALRRRYADVTTADVAETLALPLDTLEAWLRGAPAAVTAPAAPRT